MNERDERKLAELLAKKKQEQKQKSKEQRQFANQCKKYFGMNPSEITEQLKEKNYDIKVSDFEQKIRQFYDLKTDEDCQHYIDIMLNENSRSFWNARK